MNTTTAKARGGKVVDVEVIRERDYKHFGKVHQGRVAEGHRAIIEVGRSITLHGAARPGSRYVRDDSTGRMVPSTRPILYCKTYSIGDSAEYDSYNLSYSGEIVSITEKTVTIRDRHSRDHRLSLYQFDSRNWDWDAEAAATRNSEWRD